jgi:hypothetical protein
MATELVDQMMTSNDEADLKSDPAFQQGVEEGLLQDSIVERQTFKRLISKSDSLLGMNDLKSWRRDKQRGKASSSSGAAPTRKGKDS